MELINQISHGPQAVEDFTREMIEGFRAGNGRERPCVTLAYAQSLDGCITINRGESTPVSCAESLIMTHRLRAMHDSILVGINTVMIDDPRLNVRYAEGKDPTPVVVDSSLKIPLESRLFENGETSPIIASTVWGNKTKEQQLAQRGIRVLKCAATAERKVDLAELFRELKDINIDTVMVEGGNEVITSLLRARMVDLLILTISPKIFGGVRAVGSLYGLLGREAQCLHNLQYFNVGDDMVVMGEFAWGP